MRFSRYLTRRVPFINQYQCNLKKGGLRLSGSQALCNVNARDGVFKFMMRVSKISRRHIRANAFNVRVRSARQLTFRWNTLKVYSPCRAIAVIQRIRVNSKVRARRLSQDSNMKSFNFAEIFLEGCFMNRYPIRMSMITRNILNCGYPYFEVSNTSVS